LPVKQGLERLGKKVLAAILTKTGPMLNIEHLYGSAPDEAPVSSTAADGSKVMSPRISYMNLQSKAAMSDTDLPVRLLYKADDLSFNP
jgi:hypothetical protein